MILRLYSVFQMHIKFFICVSVTVRLSKPLSFLGKVKMPGKKRSWMPFKLKFTIRGLVSQEVNFKACWQYTNEMQSILVSLKVVMSLYSMHACCLYSLELNREIQLQNVKLMVNQNSASTISMH